VGDDEFLWNCGLELMHDRFVRDAMEAVTLDAKGGYVGRQRQRGDDFRHGAMEVGVEYGKVGDGRKETN
jgi:hypothetical protein